MHDFLYLASQSPRRRLLLEQMGVRHELLLPTPDEDAEALEMILPREAPADYVLRVTLLKLRAALRRRQRLGWTSAPVLCADTTVALGRRILGKPENPADARQMLLALSGREHRVWTAVAVGTGRTVRHALSVSVVRFDALSPTWVDSYVRSGEPMGKAGAYAIQGRAATRIASIRGSHSGIMGLPIYETSALIQGLIRQG
ncbi:MAG: Maf family protein [Alphaproteobacteria bacterium]|nr:Maf family protein [Alphaproteobacteria bacterium]